LTFYEPFWQSKMIVSELFIVVHLVSLWELFIIQARTSSKPPDGTRAMPPYSVYGR
jgi:hypothetical protein